MQSTVSLGYHPPLTFARTSIPQGIVVSPSQQQLQDPNDADDEDLFQSTKF